MELVLLKTIRGCNKGMKNERKEGEEKRREKESNNEKGKEEERESG